MNDSVDELGSWDLFFYYGKNKLDLEIKSDVMAICLQPARSLFYNNLDSSGVVGYENYPNELNLQINIRFAIANAIAWKNTIISNGSNNLPDRRIAVSQFSISFNRNNSGELDCSVLYIPYYNYTAYKTINPPIAGSK